MRRIYAILFDALSVPLILLSLAMVTLWVRSYWRADWVEWGSDVSAAATSDGEPTGRQKRATFGSIGGRIGAKSEVSEFPRAQGGWFGRGLRADSQSITADEVQVHRVLHVGRTWAAQRRTRIRLPGDGYFEWRTYVYDPPHSRRWIRTWGLYAPHWFIALLTGILPAFRAMSAGAGRRRRKHSKRGL